MLYNTGDIYRVDHTVCLCQSGCMYKGYGPIWFIHVDTKVLLTSSSFLMLISKKLLYMRSRKASHSVIFSAVSLTSCSSPCDIKYMNFWWLLSVEKLGHFSLICSNHMERFPYSGQSISMCCSVSTSVSQYLHHLLSLGILGVK